MCPQIGTCEYIREMRPPWQILNDGKISCRINEKMSLLPLHPSNHYPIFLSYLSDNDERQIPTAKQKTDKIRRRGDN